VCRRCILLIRQDSMSDGWWVRDMTHLYHICPSLLASRTLWRALEPAEMGLQVQLTTHRWLSKNNLISSTQCARQTDRQMYLEKDQAADKVVVSKGHQGAFISPVSMCILRNFAGEKSRFIRFDSVSIQQLISYTVRLTQMWNMAFLLFPRLWKNNRTYSQQCVIFWICVRFRYTCLYTTNSTSCRSSLRLSVSVNFRGCVVSLGMILLQPQHVPCNDVLIVSSN